MVKGKLKTMFNKVILIGRLTSDIELRKTNDSIPYTYFTLAVNRQGKSDVTDFVSCVA
jgi:single-strand DNA-binding protein